MNDHSFFMQRCLELAVAGFPDVIPNPAVGCVIVHGDQIIGEGWHRKFGGPHAEVNAIENVGDRSVLPFSVLYVNLEPCSHHGKTPPCAELIIKYGIKKVVVATADPNPLVYGKGIKMLRESGIEVVTGILEKEARELNKRFFCFHLNKRPYIILKWAQTDDGFIAGEGGKPVCISNEYSRMLVHKWRTEEMAIMAGTKTILNDDPALTARNWPGKNPVRVLLDSKLKLDPKLHVFEPNADVLVFNSLKNEIKNNIRFIKIDFNGNVPSEIAGSLFENGIQSIIIEGGTTLLNTFLASGFWDESRVFIAEKILNDGIEAPVFDLSNAICTEIGNDRLFVRRNPQASSL